MFSSEEEKARQSCIKAKTIECDTRSRFKFKNNSLGNPVDATFLGGKSKIHRTRNGRSKTLNRKSHNQKK